MRRCGDVAVEGMLMHLEGDAPAPPMPRAEPTSSINSMSVCASCRVVRTVGRSQYRRLLSEPNTFVSCVAAKRMREYEDSVKNSTDLAGKARNLDQEAVAKAAHAGRC